MRLFDLNINLRLIYFQGLITVLMHGWGTNWLSVPLSISRALSSLSPSKKGVVKFFISTGVTVRKP